LAKIYARDRALGAVCNDILDDLKNEDGEGTKKGKIKHTSFTLRHFSAYRDKMSSLDQKTTEGE